VNQQDKSRIRFSRILINSSSLTQIAKNQKLFNKFFKTFNESNLFQKFTSSDFKNYTRLEQICDGLLEIFENDKNKLSIWDIRLLGIRFLAQIGYSCLSVVKLGSGEISKEIISETFQIVPLASIFSNN
jgi:hypothetical protein